MGNTYCVTGKIFFFLSWKKCVVKTRICFKLMMQSGDFKNEERNYGIFLAPMNGLGRFLWQFKGRD